MLNADLLLVIHEDIESIEEEKKEDIPVIRKENFPVIGPTKEFISNPFGAKEISK